MRLLFIVSAHSGPSYSAIISELGGQGDESSAIDWNSNMINSLPTPSSFARRFAVCLVAVDVWNDFNLPLASKLRSAKLWELAPRNDPMTQSDGIFWPGDEVESIDGILNLGFTEHDDETISVSRKRPVPRDSRLRFVPLSQ